MVVFWKRVSLRIAMCHDIFQKYIWKQLQTDCSDKVTRRVSLGTETSACGAQGGKKGRECAPRWQTDVARKSVHSCPFLGGVVLQMEGSGHSPVLLWVDAEATMILVLTWSGYSVWCPTMDLWKRNPGLSSGSFETLVILSTRLAPECWEQI